MPILYILFMAVFVLYGGCMTHKNKSMHSLTLYRKCSAIAALDGLLWLRKGSGSTGSMEVAAQSSLSPTMHKAEANRREGAGVKGHLPRGRHARWGSCSVPQAAAGPSRGCCNIPRTRKTCPSAKTRTEPETGHGRQRRSEVCCSLGLWAGEERTLGAYRAGGISGTEVSTQPLLLCQFCTHSLSNLSGSSMAQGQVYRLKPGGLGLNLALQFQL